MFLPIFVDFRQLNAVKIDMKSIEPLQDKQLKGLKRLRKEGKIKQYGLLSPDPEYFGDSISNSSIYCP
jgi:hypothetical protein